MSSSLEAFPYLCCPALHVTSCCFCHYYGRDLLDALIAKSRQEGRKGVTLTCLEQKLGYYGSFGFENRGVSNSVHGGAVWYDMVLPF